MKAEWAINGTGNTRERDCNRKYRKIAMISFTLRFCWFFGDLHKWKITNWLQNGYKFGNSKVTTRHERQGNRINSRINLVNKKNKLKLTIHAFALWIWTRGENWKRFPIFSVKKVLKKGLKNEMIYDKLTNVIKGRWLKRFRQSIITREPWWLIQFPREQNETYFGRKNLWRKEF